MLGYVRLGLLAGFASGCCRIAGGIIMAPVMVLLCKFDYPVAVGSSLALIIPISLAGSATNFSLGKFNWPLVGACALAGAVGAVPGSLFIDKIPAVYAKRAFAVFRYYPSTFCPTCGAHARRSRCSC